MISNNVFELIEFSDVNLSKWLSFGSDIFKATKNIDYQIIKEDELRQKQQFNFFLDYLKDDDENLKAKYILIEKEYISKSYLSDYQSYYVKFHNSFPRNTVRLHFIKEISDLNIGEISNLNNLYSKLLKIKDFENKYIGYIVVKPVPNSTIGATLLRQYECDCITPDKTRCYLATRDYDINIFGKQISNFKSMIFMEQDKAVGACSTFALWSGLHVLCDIFDIPILTPSEITEKAKLKYHSTSGDSFEKGLSTTQIINGLKEIGLYSSVYNFDITNIKSKDSNTYEINSTNQIETSIIKIKKILYAYLKLGIPIFALTKPIGIDDQRHMITINGFRNNQSDKGETQFGNIDVFYAHDDRLGPFSKYKFVGNCIQRYTNNKIILEDDEKNHIINEINNSRIVLDTCWKDVKTSKKIFFTLYHILIALPKEIKVDFDDIEQIIYEFNVKLPQYEIVCTLQRSNKYKEDLLYILNGSINNEFVGTKNLPKFIWVMNFFNKSTKTHLFDLIYDTENPTNKHVPIASQLIDPTFKDTIEKYRYSFGHKQDIKKIKYINLADVRFRVEELLINDVAYCKDSNLDDLRIDANIDCKISIIGQEQNAIYNFEGIHKYFVENNLKDNSEFNIKKDLSSVDFNNFSIGCNSKIMKLFILDFIKTEVEKYNALDLYEIEEIQKNNMYFYLIEELLYPKFRSNDFITKIN